MIEIRVTNTEGLDKLRQLAAKGRILEPFMRKAAGIMADAVEENFEEEGRPRWPSLSAATIKDRERRGNWPGKMLQRSGQLASSISRHYDDTSASVGTNKIYAAIQNLGGKAGRGKKVEVPAREFMKLGEDDERRLERVVKAIFDDLR
ncbi:phage virion morphogenesis protein [Fundidesulfovibrio putealis]|uniref:phage virion morphogenesis protein n=1 Tax=Fundidesulfovibrio putealis TaxID=270496 RepID=UPI0004182547|nr:phage virion morphogenesis protein [Fundidesulfovibrio putealis]